MYGRSKTSNSLAPSGPNLARLGASIWTAPSCRASSSSLSLYSWLFGKTCTCTRPLVRSSASFLKYSAALPFGVSCATTWLNLITKSAALAMPETPKARLATRAAYFSFILYSPVFVVLRGPVVVRTHCTLNTRIKALASPLGTSALGKTPISAHGGRRQFGALRPTRSFTCICHAERSSSCYHAAPPLGGRHADPAGFAGRAVRAVLGGVQGLARRAARRPDPGAAVAGPEPAPASGKPPAKRGRHGDRHAAGAQRCPSFLCRCSAFATRKQGDRVGAVGGAARRGVAGWAKAHRSAAGGRRLRRLVA